MTGTCDIGGLARPRLARLPTPEQIMAEVRRRPIGAVIADICHDLGVMPNHPRWRDMERAMIEHGGSHFRLVMDTINRPIPLADQPPSAATPAALRAASRLHRAALNFTLGLDPRALT
jgi:hypothetical protein